MAMTPTARRNAAWIAVAVVVIAIIAIFTIPDDTSMSDPTSGTPPAATTAPPAATPVPPADTTAPPPGTID